MGERDVTQTVAEQRLTLALDAARLGSWHWDMASGRTTWDERLEELHGLAPGGFGGTFEDWVAALHPDDRSECLMRVEAALEDPGPYVLSHRTTWPDGSVHFIECRGTVLVDGAGNAAGTTGVAFDVTERHHRDADLANQLAQERELVQVLQRVLLPTELPSLPGTDVAARYLASDNAADVGGDWYAVLPLSGHRLGLAVGDVAGHGLSAVSEMASARFSLRALGLSGQSPDRVLGRLSQVVGVFDPETIITALYGILDTEARTWTYASAGHMGAVLRGPDGTARVLDPRNDPPLGLAKSLRRRRVTLQPRSTLVLFTDGLIERRNESIADGIERLRQACADGPQRAGELCDHLLSTLRVEASNPDDIAILAVTID